jgi:hypothetical protein
MEYARGLREGQADAMAEIVHRRRLSGRPRLHGALRLSRSHFSDYSIFSTLKVIANAALYNSRPAPACRISDGYGAGEGNRTLDTQLGKLMFCH